MPYICRQRDCRQRALGLLSVVGGIVILVSVLGFALTLALAYTLSPLLVGIASFEMIVGVYLGYVGTKTEEIEGSVAALLASIHNTPREVGRDYSGDYYYSDRAMAAIKEKEQNAKESA